MALQIVVNQSGKPAGVAGRAREDLALNVPVVLSAVGGPFAAYRWSILSKPINVVTATRSGAVLSSPLLSTTQCSPVNVAGTHLVELVVDSGDGLGASDADVATITFYAGPALASDPRRMPRRVPAFGERGEHNAPDAIEPLGNTEAWAREMARWFAAVSDLSEGRLWAGARVRYNIGAGQYQLQRGFNVASVSAIPGRSGCRVTFQTPMPDALYAAHASPLSGDAPGNVAFPFDILTTQSYVDVNFMDETTAEVTSSFSLRCELGVG